MVHLFIYISIYINKCYYGKCKYKYNNSSCICMKKPPMGIEPMIVSLQD